MKTKRIFSTIVLFAICTFLVLPFQSCDPDRKNKNNKVVYKPNIYIYPERDIELEVTIDFPLGGEIIRSIPLYNTGWKISVDENGMIDNEYAYLFYESKQPDIWQTKEGWIIEAEELEQFFRENMQAYGFEGQEIEDFVEYWIPKFNVYKYYSIYPQTIDLIEDVIRLSFSEEPNNILRLFYLVEGSDVAEEELTEPEIESFNRNGYFVTEWGVIL